MPRRPAPKRLGKKLLKIRLGMGLSQAQMVKALNYKASPLRASQISRYEQGDREPPSMLLLAYAKLAGISTDVLIDDTAKLPD